MHKIVHTIYSVTMIAAVVAVAAAIGLGALICTVYDCYQIYRAAH